jgi:hypothetical protein
MQLARKFIKNEKALYEQYLYLELYNHLSFDQFPSKYILPVKKNNALNNIMKK